MTYMGELIKINGSALPQIVSYKVGRNKKWKDTGCNMEGAQRSTLIGIFPEIEIQIGVLNQSQLSSLCRILDQAFFNVEWFDLGTEGTHTAQYQASDYSTDILDKRRGLYEKFSVKLVPVSKR